MLSSGHKDHTLISLPCAEAGQIIEIIAVADADFKDHDDDFELQVQVGGKTVQKQGSMTREKEAQVILLSKFALEETAEVSVVVTLVGKIDKQVYFQPGSIQVSLKAFESGRNPQINSSCNTGD